MLIPLLLFGLCCGACLVLTPPLRRLAVRCGLVDLPDGGRKMHPEAVPLAGGFILLLSWSVVVPFFLPVLDTFPGNEDHPSLAGLLLAALLIVGVGFLDDFWGLRGRHKLVGQLLAAGIVMASGTWVRHLHLFGATIDLGLLALPFTLFWLLGAMNSFNLLDGMDGLLASVGLVVSLAFTALALWMGHGSTACLGLALAGALLGFLPYNFPSARVFLGDSGSMLLGLLVGVLALHSVWIAPHTFPPAIPAAILAIPIMDSAAALVRRKLTGRSLYIPDRGHLHHCLLRRGLSTKQVLGIVAGLCLWTVLGATVGLLFDSDWLALLMALMVPAFLACKRWFGFAECLLVRDRLVGILVSFFRYRPNKKPLSTEVRLQGTADWKDMWKALTQLAIRLNLQTIQLNVNAPAIHEGYHARWDRFSDDPESPDLWRAEIPLVVGEQNWGQIRLAGQRDFESIWLKIAHVAKFVEDFEKSLTMLATGEADAKPVETLPLPSGETAVRQVG